MDGRNVYEQEVACTILVQTLLQLKKLPDGHLGFRIPTQIIDRTKGIRPATFFDGTIVAHTAFGDPFANQFVAWLKERVEKVLEESGNGAKLHTGKCIICMEGPQFSTRAESKMYRAWGADLINMSVLPEAKLAKEAELRCVSRRPSHDTILSETAATP